MIDKRPRLEAQAWRESIVQGFMRVEDAVYAGLGTLLAGIDTVQVSFRDHALVPGPFLIVGLIAAIRRLLVLTAEFARFLEKGDGALTGAMLELGLLTVMIPRLQAPITSPSSSSLAPSGRSIRSPSPLVRPFSFESSSASICATASK